MLADLRFALRALRRSPGFVLAAVLCLGLGLGANAMVYAVLDGMLLRPLPFADADRLVTVRRGNRATGASQDFVSRPYLLDLRARSRTVAPLSGYAVGTVSVDGPHGSEAVTGARVSAELFAVLGARPLLGRGFRPDESAPGAPRVAVLSEALWRERYQADPDVVGRAVVLNGQPTTVVGVMPARVGITGDRERLWLPLEHRLDEAERGSMYLSVVGRLAPGATLDGARRELDALGREVARAHPAVDAEAVPRLTRLLDERVPPDLAAVFGAMFGAVGFVLLIACANVASLLLARASGRARELAVRAALGAPRARVLRLVVLESVLVAAAGGALGLAVARAGLAAMLGAVPVVYPSWLTFAVDARVVAYALLLALGAGTLLGLVPALRATRPSLAPTLRDGGRGAAGAAGGRWLRGGLVTAQLALTVVLLAGAGLLVKSVLRLRAADPGFDPRGVLAVQVFAPGARYDRPAARIALLAQARERLAALPGAAAVTTTSIAPLSGDWSSDVFAADGQAVAPAGREPWAHLRRVGDGYFALLRHSLVAGREFTPAEAADTGAAVAVVSETLARRTWPNASPLGRRLSVGPGPDARRFTVVGVARDAQLVGLERRPEAAIFLPHAATVERNPTFLVRTAGDPGALAPAARRALRVVDPTLGVVALQPMPAIVRQSLWRGQLFGGTFGAFAAAALVLALVGVYGVVAYTVAARTRDLGVRLALGARPRDVYRAVLGGSARLAALGLGAGAVLALALTRVLASALPNVSPRDPAVLLGVVGALAAATLAASWVPARRATRLDPVASLRGD